MIPEGNLDLQEGVKNTGYGKRDFKQERVFSSLLKYI